jgi:membrane associated rhomboid family serine protease
MPKTPKKLDTDYLSLDDDGDSSRPSASSYRSPTPRSDRKKNRRQLSSQDSCSGTSFSRSEDFQKIFDKGGPQENEEEEEVYLVRQRYGYFSILFSIAQVLILIIMMCNCGVAPLNINPMIGPYPDALSEWGGKNAVNILDDGEWWRLLTPIMLHAGVIHLLCNIAVQVETGAFFEREWGSRNWLIIYLVSAVGSSILSVIFMPDAVSVGSSGAVMGLFGGKLAEVICRYCESDKTEQGRIGHQVRKEQCAGATCSVIIVMLFSFIPYGKIQNRTRTRTRMNSDDNVGGDGTNFSPMILFQSTGRPIWEDCWRAFASVRFCLHAKRQKRHGNCCGWRLELR